MAQHKLYTKEMFLQAAEKCEVSMIDAKHIMEYIDEYVRPIKLPSDEEIVKFASQETNNINEQIVFNNGAIYVCKLIEEQIFNQNK